ncbi:MAG TPA: glycosyltransferase family 39 protein [Terriglobales bacterium]|jgi:4-amino-4-deoxy-L-arabinose transferase-like glycosyltransferase
MSSRTVRKAVAGSDPNEISGHDASPRRRWIWIVLLWAIVYLPGLFSPPLLDDADSIHAEAARELIVRHDWTTLYIDGVRYLEKAPLMYWGMAASYTIFGTKDWAARLPLALGVLALLLATYSLGKRTLGERAGFWAAIVLTVSVGPYLFTRFIIPDLLVGLWLTLGFDFFLRTLDEEPPSRLSCWGLAATAALNVLTKGLIGLVFPAAIIGLYLVLTGNLKHLLRMRLLSSFAVLLVMAAPWHIAAALENPPAGQSRGFLWFYFVNEQFLRYLNKRVPPDYDTVPLIVFWGLMLVWLFPWSAFVFQSLAQVPRRWSEWHSGMNRRQRALLLYAIWAAVILVFFSFSTRQEYYAIPALPGLALLIGGWLQQEEESPAASKLRRNGQIGSMVLLVLSVVVFATAMFLLMQSKSMPADSDLADLLKKNPNEYALALGHLFDLTPRALGLFRGPLATFSIALLVGTLLNLLYRRRNFAQAGNWVLTIMMVFALFAVHQGLAIFSPILSSKKLADAIEQEYRPGDVLVVNGTYEDASTLNFYTRQPIHIVNSREEGNMYYGALFPDAPSIFEDDVSLQALWKGPKRVFLWVEEDNVPLFIKQSGSYHLARSGGKLILMNRVLPKNQ